MFRFVFFAALLIFGLAMAKLTTSVADRGDHESEIDTVRSTPVERIARTGLNDSETLDAWIEQEFYVGRFEVSWSASDIADGLDAGKVRVSADMSSNSQLQLERSIVLRFDIDPQSRKVTFAGMVLEGAEVSAASGRPYSLEEAMTRMWEHRNKVYMPDSPDDSDS